MRRVTVQWIPPLPGISKVNVDAAVAKSTCRGTVGAVGHDEHGQFIGASAVVLDGVTDSETLEYYACREALALGGDLHLHNLCVSLDCLRVIKDLEGENTSVATA